MCIRDRHNEDWKNICKDEAIYCPKCGKSETSDKWFTTEQVEEGKRQACLLYTSY